MLDGIYHLSFNYTISSNQTNRYNSFKNSNFNFFQSHTENYNIIIIQTDNRISVRIKSRETEIGPYKNLMQEFTKLNFTQGRGVFEKNIYYRLSVESQQQTKCN